MFWLLLCLNSGIRRIRNFRLGWLHKVCAAAKQDINWFRLIIVEIHKSIFLTDYCICQIWDLFITNKIYSCTFYEYLFVVSKQAAVGVTRKRRIIYKILEPVVLLAYSFSLLVCYWLSSQFQLQPWKLMLNLNVIPHWQQKAKKKKKKKSEGNLLDCLIFTYFTSWNSYLFFWKQIILICFGLVNYLHMWLPLSFFEEWQSDIILPRNYSGCPINYFSKISSPTALLIVTAYETIKSWLWVTSGCHAGCPINLMFSLALKQSLGNHMNSTVFSKICLDLINKEHRIEMYYFTLREYLF